MFLMRGDEVEPIRKKYRDCSEPEPTRFAVRYGQCQAGFSRKESCIVYQENDCTRDAEDDGGIHGKSPCHIAMRQHRQQACSPARGARYACYGPERAGWKQVPDLHCSRCSNERKRNGTVDKSKGNVMGVAFSEDESHTCMSWRSRFTERTGSRYAISTAEWASCRRMQRRFPAQGERAARQRRSRV